MNEHLKPVFDLLLPKLDAAKIDYWVYGGVSIAGMFSQFHRYNKDVDVFVKNADFEDARLALESVCENQEFNHCTKTSPETARPKFEIFDSDMKEIFSMIPVYQEGSDVIFKYPKAFGGSEVFSVGIYEKEERYVSGYRFFTSQDKYVKEFFIKHMKTRPKERLMMRPNTFCKDAKLLLSVAEIKEIEDYYG